MEISKPKSFNLPKKSNTDGLSIWGARPHIIIHPFQQPQIVNHYNLQIGNQTWDVICPTPKMHIERVNVMGEFARSMMECEPLNVEFYNCEVDFFNSDLCQWMREISEHNTNSMRYYRDSVKDLRFDGIGIDEHFILYDAFLASCSVNENYRARFDVDATVECQFTFNRWEHI